MPLPSAAVVVVVIAVVVAVVVTAVLLFSRAVSGCNCIAKSTTHRMRVSAARGRASVCVRVYVTLCVYMCVCVHCVGVSEIYFNSPPGSRQLSFRYSSRTGSCARTVGQSRCKSGAINFIAKLSKEQSNLSKEMNIKN